MQRSWTRFTTPTCASISLTLLNSSRRYQRAQIFSFLKSKVFREVTHRQQRWANQLTRRLTRLSSTTQSWIRRPETNFKQMSKTEPPFFKESTVSPLSSLFRKPKRASSTLRKYSDRRTNWLSTPFAKSLSLFWNSSIWNWCKFLRSSTRYFREQSISIWSGSLSTTAHRQLSQVWR